MSCPSVSIPYHRLVSELSVCLHIISSPRVRQRRAAERRAATTAVGARERGTRAAAAAESGGRRSGGGLRDRMCVGEGAVRLSVSSWLRHHSSVTISSPRVRPRRAAGRVATAVERRSESGGARGAAAARWRRRRRRRWRGGEGGDGRSCRWREAHTGPLAERARAARRLVCNCGWQRKRRAGPGRAGAVK